MRPARPLRWLAAARLSGYTCSASIPICAAPQAHRRHTLFTPWLQGVYIQQGCIGCTAPESKEYSNIRYRYLYTSALQGHKTIRAHQRCGMQGPSTLARPADTPQAEEVRRRLLSVAPAEVQGGEHTLGL